MKYRWLKKQTCEELSQELGCAVKSMTLGPIPIGAEGVITQEGVEIELDGETPRILERLDVRLQGLKREGGRDIAKVVEDNIVLTHPNPYKESYKLSQLYGLTQQQLENYIDNQMSSITNLAQARTVIGELIKKMAKVELCLVKQTRLDEGA